MNPQGQTQSLNDSNSSQPQGAGFAMENQNRHPIVPQHGYTHGSNAGLRDTNVNVLSQQFSGLNIQPQQAGAKGFPVKAGHPMHPHSSSMDMTGLQHYPHGHYMLIPNGSMFGGVPPTPQYGQFPMRAADQVSPPYFPGYPWPYWPNGDYPDHANPSHNFRASVDDKNPGSPMVDVQSEYYPPIDRSSMGGCLFNPHQPQPYVPYQMMKSSSGYVLQDLDALVKQDPPIPRAVPAMWTNPSDLTLAKCLENREGITNVYIRGFLPETTDDMLYGYASRFGKIDRCKAIVDLDTGLCKGFGFVQFFGFEACENCIRGFFHLGYQASFAQKSRNSRLKDLEDRSSTNVYCTNVPIDWVEADLRRHFEPYKVVSEKISRDEKTGISKEVGFARFESREIAEQVLAQYHSVPGKDGVKLLLRFADTKAQKQLKHQSNERRAYRAGEYNFSVEMVQGSTPSPSLHRLQQAASHFSPGSQGSFASPQGVGPVWTPATSISPPNRGRFASATKSPLGGDLSTPSNTMIPFRRVGGTKSENSTPLKAPGLRSVILSPTPTRKEIIVSTPRSST
ncbi:hypothetical protein FQN57_004151 [Myotisia sp. PD_48]|nr:hypothetical protein FQN57_004151 [Myotisia sp. PD_48]